MSYQSGITGLGTTDHGYYELSLVHDTPQARQDAVRALVEAANLPSTAGSNIVVGVRPTLWAEVAAAEDVPAGVHDFAEPLRGAGGYSMPATQHDAWLWVASSSRSQVFDVAKHILGAVKEHFTCARETIGWVYENNRDLTGFEDGTENPGQFEAPGIVAIPAGEPGEGASVLLFQHWLHKAADWEALSVHEQQDIIGRTKADSVELDEDVMPDSSHVSRTVVDVDGEELDVFRRNTAYGDLSGHGTVFVGFSFDQWRLEEMLRRMAGADGGPRDMLTHFTTATSGSWYVIPSLRALAGMLPEDDED
ncbi:peroxidase [Corynebacterium sp. 13CS0277]|uniref:Dyp-type peroxidase n=1 Tax=Corynebacterium sp. 13CS0277 TaxID=2071994 RepID=UPI000D02BF07|nr:Dyp-type peroxidase [Corynebacterium sp. 13CS0277]PRQ10314.1 peroxidase [Corynebacterium sp. 13CS0277]